MCLIRLTLLAWVLLMSAVFSVAAELRLTDRLLENNFNYFLRPAPAKNMLLLDVTGRRISLSSLKGKVVILNFWRLNCPPCLVEKPILERVYRKYNVHGLEILCVNLFDEQERLRSYTSKTSFSFWMGFDPSRRLTLKTQTLPGGGQTNFVINDKSEAIYEVPGAPTTYLIDKTGKVVGYSAGLINWEEEPFDELLENTLGLTKRAVYESGFNVAARQGGPVGNPRPPEPFQSPQASIEDSEKQPVPEAKKAPSPTKTDKEPGSNQGTMKNKSTGASPTERKSRPRRSGTHEKPKANPETVRTVPAPVPGTPTSSVQDLAKHSGSPLPPALPYIPPGKRPPEPTAPMNVDETGSVVARIPAAAESPKPLIHPSSIPGNLPPAQRVGSSNSIDSFILDSFESAPTNQPPATAPEFQNQTQTKPATSVVNQLGADLRNLGAGIRDTFSRILPAPTE